MTFEWKARSETHAVSATGGHWLSVKASAIGPWIIWQAWLPGYSPSSDPDFAGKAKTMDAAKAAAERAVES